MEGANLSGLEKEPSELVTLLVNMAEEVANEKSTKLAEQAYPLDGLEHHQLSGFLLSLF